MLSYADNVALPAFAGRAAIDRYIMSPALMAQQQTYSSRFGPTVGQTDRQTDGRPTYANPQQIEVVELEGYS